jgi:uncharacterized protein Yka (UPF0111/DUF47 family)
MNNNPEIIAFDDNLDNNSPEIIDGIIDAPLKNEPEIIDMPEENIIISKPTEEMLHQGKVVIKATTELVYCVSLLKKLHKMQAISDSRNTIKEIETLGDDVLYRATEDLFSGKFDAITVIKYKDIYKDLEDALDKCTSVADIVLNIAAKNN